MLRPSDYTSPSYRICFAIRRAIYRLKTMCRCSILSNRGNGLLTSTYHSNIYNPNSIASTPMYQNHQWWKSVFGCIVCVCLSSLLMVFLVYFFLFSQYRHGAGGGGIYHNPMYYAFQFNNKDYNDLPIPYTLITNVHNPKLMAITNYNDTNNNNNNDNDNNNNNVLKKNSQEKENSIETIDSLILVAGHAVFRHSNFQECRNPAMWYLQKHQKQEQHLEAFLEQIQKGIDLATVNQNSLLIFSGGQTRPDAGPFSEAQSYWKLAENCHHFHGFDTIRDRTFTEEFAMDSFQNLLFSVCRFREITGHYPKNVSVISWSFKHNRFVNLHRKAILYPKPQFHFIGVDGGVNITAQALYWEKKAYTAFVEDIYGCEGLLKQTRIVRNPYFRSIPYPNSCPEISSLFHICLTEQQFDEQKDNIKVPWS